MDFKWVGTAFTVSSSENVTAAKFSIKARNFTPVPQKKQEKAQKPKENSNARNRRPLFKLQLVL